MPRRDPKIVKAETGRIMQLLLEDNSDKDIIRELDISREYFYKLKSKLFRDSAKAFAQKDIQDIAFHVDMLHDKLTAYLKIIDEEIKNCTDPETKIELINTAREIIQDRHDLNMQSLDILVEKGGIRIERINNKEAKELV